MSWDIIATYAVAACLIVGAAFSIIGSIGLLKFNDPMTRLHAPTKVGTVGVGALLLAAMIHSYTMGEGVLHEILIMAFLFVTAPISANFMAKVNLHRRNCDLPPPPVEDDTWSTLNVPEADRDLVEQRPT
jgi:multicomponent K+:H+ antiporter subunit G